MPSITMSYERYARYLQLNTLFPLRRVNGAWRESRIGIEIEIKGPIDFRADEVTVSVSGTGGILFEEKCSSAFHTPGAHLWRWDGFDRNGIFDTRELKRFIVRAEMRSQGATYKSELTLKSEGNKVPWIDARIDTKRLKIDIEVYADCQNAGGLESSEFERLKGLVLSGISKYWSRNRGIEIGGTAYFCTVSGVQRTEDSEDLDIYVEKSSDYARSHNSGIIDGSLKYNKGFFGTKLGADLDFEETSAHEFGHAILEAYGGKALSWGHKGTVYANPVKFWEFQDAKETAPTYPATGEIDLMKYYRGGKPSDFYQRVTAAEEDVLRLVWLAQRYVSKE